MLDQNELEREVKAAIKAKVDAAVGSVDIATLVARTVDMVIAERVGNIVNMHVNNLVKQGKLEKELDAKYQGQIYDLMVQEVKQKTAHTIARVDMPTEVGKQIVETLSNKMKVAALPEKFINHKNVNWEGFLLSANHITAGVISQFSSTGIQDVADGVELTVADGVVVVENNFVSRKAEIKETLFAENVVVKNLKINDQLVLNEGINRQLVSLMKDTIAKETIGKVVDVAVNPILANGKEILTDNALGPSITQSNLRKLGRLNELNVSGQAYFNDTMIVTDQGKIGVNTIEPEGVLTLWDDDSELTIRRHKKKNMYIGTMRDTSLSIGVNGSPKLEVFGDGTILLKVLSIDGLRISVSDKVPTGNGSPGEIIIMNNARDDEPWAYRCLGNNKWKAIK